MTKSTQVYSRIGDTRILAPFLLQPLAIWAMLRFWPDEHDQRILRQVQFQLRRDGVPPQPHITKKQRVLSADQRFGDALMYVTFRYLQDCRYKARFLFAEAVKSQNAKYQITRPFDLSAAWSGLVKRNFDNSTPEGAMLWGTKDTPIEVHMVIGATEIDTLVMDGGIDAANDVASRTCEALLAAYPGDCN